MHELNDLYTELITGKIPAFWQWPNGELVEFTYPIWVTTIHLYPGSFNPLHDGHRALFDSIGRDQELPPATTFYSWRMNTGLGLKTFEISLKRRDKDLLNPSHLAELLLQFRNYAPVVVTDVAKMHQKAGLFHGVNPHFHLGHDTAQRFLWDEGALGVQGIAAQFHVYPRGEHGWSELLERPWNFQEGQLHDARHTHLSSTALRKGEVE